MTKQPSIRLSPKHGVNPSMEICFLCGEEKGTIVLLGLMKGRERSDPEAPRHICLNKEPCDTCAKHMKQGVILIEVVNNAHGENPPRAGGFAVVKDEAIKRMIQPPELLEQVLTHRVTFVPTDAWDMLGLPSRRNPNIGSTDVTSTALQAEGNVTPEGNDNG